MVTVPPMSDGTEDDKSEAVKRAMGNKRRIALDVIEGGLSDPDENAYSLYGDRPLNDRPEPPDDAYRQDEGPPDDADPSELDGARHCASYDQNDRDNARRLIYWFGLDLAYVPGMGWLVFHSTHWIRDEGELEISLRAQNVVDKIKLEAVVLQHSEGEGRLLALAEKAEQKPEDDLSAAERKLIQRGEKLRKALSERRSKRRAFAVTSGNRGRTVAMIAQAASMRAVDPKILDANHMKFNVLNGTLTFGRDLDPERPDDDSTRKVAKIDFADEADRADMITKVADVEYDPEAECPRFMEFLTRVQPDPAMRTFLQVGHAFAMLLGGNGEQVVFFHYGSGANGKSVFIETLGRLAGGYRAVVSPETFTGDQQKQGQQASPDIARLVNTRFVTVEELPRGVSLKENMIKAASGGTKMVARFLQKEFFEFDPKFTTVMSGNDMPQVSGTDYGIWRRLKITPWEVTIPEEERMPFETMLEMLDAERSGILNWLIEGIKLYLANGLTPYIPGTVKAFTEDYREERDQVGVFVESCLIRTEGGRVNASDMFKAYSDWCDANGLTAWKQTPFGLRMVALGFKKEKGRTYSYLDVKLGDIPHIADPRTPTPPPRDNGDPGWTPQG